MDNTTPIQVLLRCDLLKTFSPGWAYYKISHEGETLLKVDFVDVQTHERDIGPYIYSCPRKNFTLELGVRPAIDLMTAKLVFDIKTLRLPYNGWGGDDIGYPLWFAVLPKNLDAKGTYFYDKWLLGQSDSIYEDPFFKLENCEPNVPAAPGNSSKGYQSYDIKKNTIDRLAFEAAPWSNSYLSVNALPKQV